jgi:hypothetical protein
VASEAIFIIAKDVGVAYQLRSQMIHLQLDKNNTGDLADNTGYLQIQSSDSTTD